MARASAITFVFYLRPSDTMTLRYWGLLPPKAGFRALANKWSIVLHAMEMGIPSKTGEFDESLLFDNPEFGWMNELLRVIKRGKDDDAKVFAFGRTDRSTERRTPSRRCSTNSGTAGLFTTSSPSSGTSPGS